MTISYLPVRAPMIVFLDAQGVLREPRDLQSLDAVLQDYPDLSIVITSVQRAEPSLAELPAPFFRLVAERTVPQTFTRPIHATSGQRLMQLHHQYLTILAVTYMSLASILDVRVLEHHEQHIQVQDFLLCNYLSVQVQLQLLLSFLET